MVEDRPLVSVIIPAFNEERFIGRLLESIKKQTYPKIETIVIDDESRDNTAEVARKFTKLVFRRTHQERSIQRNFGAKKAHGKYLIFLDADMELAAKVIEDCVDSMINHDFSALVIPEKTVGGKLIPNIRRFEREMYMKEPSIEVARMFKREVFFEFGGYDPKLTGPEDYDLPYRMSKKYTIGRSKEYIFHHEEDFTLGKLLRTKFSYAKQGAFYAQKHPELVASQGTILFRRVYLKNWRKFIREPLIGLAFLFVRSLETVWAVAGYISAVGVLNFVKILPKAIK